MTNFHVSLSNEQNAQPIDENKLEKVSIKMLKNLINNKDILKKSALNDYNLSDITINMDMLICDDKSIHEINKEFRGYDKPTDVLSFALFADNIESRIIFNNEIYLGEVIISAETAKKQADENNKPFIDEIYFLLSHGILHLFGFDHPDEESLEFMLKIQDKMISNI